MENKQKDWKVILVHCDVKLLGKQNDPAPCGKKVFRFADKDEAILKFAELFKAFHEKSYDQEVHSIAASKFYYKENDKDLLTYVLLHYKNRQYLELTVEEFRESINPIIFV